MCPTRFGRSGGGVRGRISSTPAPSMWDAEPGCKRRYSGTWGTTSSTIWTGAETPGGDSWRTIRTVNALTVSNSTRCMTRSTLTYGGSGILEGTTLWSSTLTWTRVRLELALLRCCDILRTPTSLPPWAPRGITGSNRRTGRTTAGGTYSGVLATWVSGCMEHPVTAGCDTVHVWGGLVRFVQQVQYEEVITREFWEGGKWVDMSEAPITERSYLGTFPLLASSGFGSSCLILAEYDLWGGTRKSKYLNIHAVIKVVTLPPQDLVIFFTETPGCNTGPVGDKILSRPPLNEIIITYMMPLKHLNNHVTATKSLYLKRHLMGVH